MKVPTRRGETNSLAERQGRHREVGSGGSRRQIRVPMNKNHMRPGVLGKAADNAEARSHQEWRRVYVAAIRGKLLFLSGEVCPGVTCNRVMAEIVTAEGSNPPGLPGRSQQRS